MKKLAALALGLCMVLASVGGTGAEANLDDAKALASAFLPANSVYLSSEEDDGRLELTYRLPDTDEICEVTLNRDKTAVAYIDTESSLPESSATVALSETEIREILTGLYPEARIDSVYLENDDGQYEYKVAFTGLTNLGRVSINPETGDITETEFWQLNEDGTPVDSSAGRDQGWAGTGTAAPAAEDKKQTPAPSAAADEKIGTDRARSIALEKAGSGRVTGISLDTEKGRSVYDGEIITDTQEISFEIDAYSGKIVEWETEALDKDDLKEDKHDDDKYEKDDDDGKHDKDDDDDDKYEKDDDDDDDDDD